LASDLVTLELHADRASSGRPVREEVRARLVLGIAAGDVIELDRHDQSCFVVRRRGGNIAVQIFFPAVSDEIAERFTAALGGVGGWLDGRADRQLVFSVPATGDFRPLESILNALIAAYPGAEWYYGNVYDPKDGVTPLTGGNEHELA
jgi:hypothetical protein